MIPEVVDHCWIDQTTTNGGGGDLRLIDGNYSRSETNRYASDDPTNDKYSQVLTKLMVKEGSWTTIEGERTTEAH